MAEAAKQGSFDLETLAKMYDFTGKTVAITGGAGVLGADLTRALVGCGTEVAILDINIEPGKALAESLGERGKQISLFQCNVLDRDGVAKTAEEVMAKFGKLDCLVNGAGGNKPQATTSADLKFFDLPADALTLGLRAEHSGYDSAQPGLRQDHGRPGLRDHPEHFVDELLPAADADPGVFGRQGRGEQLYAVAGRTSWRRNTRRRFA